MDWGGGGKDTREPKEKRKGLKSAWGAGGGGGRRRMKKSEKEPDKERERKSGSET